VSQKKLLSRVNIWESAGGPLSFLPQLWLLVGSEEGVTEIASEIGKVIKSKVLADISRTLELGLEEQKVLVEELCSSTQPHLSLGLSRLR
jgi:hypothetical protein